MLGSVDHRQTIRAARVEYHAVHIEERGIEPRVRGAEERVEIESGTAPPGRRRVRGRGCDWHLAPLWQVFTWQAFTWRAGHALAARPRTRASIAWRASP